MSAEIIFQKRKNDIVNEALFLASFEGWSEATLTKAAVKAGFHALEARRLFPDGVKDILRFYEEMMDASLRQKASEFDLASMRVHTLIHWLVQTKLTLMQPHKNALRQASAWRLVRLEGLEIAKGLWHISDTMWQLAGDISVDSNYYTKRSLLLHVYVSTYLFWLNDESTDGYETWDFLQRRIAAVLKLGKNIGIVRTSLVQTIEQSIDIIVNRKHYRTKQ